MAGDVSPATAPAEPAAPPSLRARLLTPRTLASFGIAAAILGLAVWRANLPWGETWDHIRHATVRLYAAALVAYYIGFAVRGLRWRVLLGNAGERRRVLPLSEIILVSFFVNCIVPAKMGDVYRAVLVRQREEVPASKALGTVIAERLVDLLVLMSLLLLAGAAVFRNHVPRFLLPYLVAGVLLCGVGLAVLALMRMGRGQRLLRALPSSMRDRYESFRHGTVHSLGRWHELLPLSVTVWGLEATRLAFVVFALGFGGLMGPAQFLLVALVAALLTTVPFTPGGVGLVELGMVGVLVKVASVPYASAVSIALLDRSISYLSLVVLGFVVFMLGHVRVEARRMPRGAEA